MRLQTEEVTCVCGTPLDLNVVDLPRISLDSGHLVVNVLYLIDLESGLDRIPRRSLLTGR